MRSIVKKMIVAGVFMVAPIVGASSVMAAQMDDALILSQAEVAWQNLKAKYIDVCPVKEFVEFWIEAEVWEDKMQELRNMNIPVCPYGKGYEAWVKIRAWKDELIKAVENGY
jgi:hypothetical protein